MTALGEFLVVHIEEVEVFDNAAGVRSYFSSTSFAKYASSTWDEDFTETLIGALSPIA